MSVRHILRYKRILIAFLLLVILLVIILFHNKSSRHVVETNSKSDPNKPRLAILVPFRDRFDELVMFVPYMSKFLANQRIGPFRIYILNQSNKYRFNRGALANVGFQLTKVQSDYIAIHDIDLIPINTNLSYAYPDSGPYHLTSPEYHPQYNYDKYFGGILLIKKEHFQLVNGFSNRYFGWGLEDDEFYTRVVAAKLPIQRPQNLTTNRNNTFLHFHYGRKRDTSKSREQRESLRHRDRITGLKDLKYSLTSKHNLTIDEHYECTVFNIDLFCDTQQTPWCLPSHVSKQSGPRKTT